MATNPAVSMPDAGRVRDALAACPFVVVSDCIAETDTSVHAHVRLPAAAWGEKDGTVTNSERMVSRQRAVLPLPGEAKPDWWIVKEVARRMGHGAAFAYDCAADIWREHVRLSRYRNDGERLFALPPGGSGHDDYDAMAPFRWGGTPFADGRYPTPDGRARLIAVRQAPAQPPLAEWPMTLNTGRYRDHWHTMTRTGLSPKLARHREEPLVEVHPADAAALGLSDGGLARVATPQGESLYRVRISGGQRPGELFVPIHWTDRTAAGGRTGLLPRPLADPHSGQPGFKNTPARIAAVAVAWHAFRIGREPLPPLPATPWATRIAVPGGSLIELAGQGDPVATLEPLLPKGERIEARDLARGTWRVAVLDEGRLSAALFVSRDAALPPRDWLIAQLGREAAPTLLAGRAPGARIDRGLIVCACFDVGLVTITRAIAEQRLVDVAAIGRALGAGTNCGSCRPALARAIADLTENADVA
jgi:assimilatory nitrate reductase catalytic subunit